MKILPILLGIALVAGPATVSAAAPKTVSATKPVAVTSGKTTAKKATKQEMIIQVLPLFVKTFGKNPTESEKAWWRKRISCNELTSIDAIVKSMQFHKSKKVTKGTQYICGLKPTPASKSEGVITRNVAGVATNNPQGDTIRVGIYSTANGKAIQVTANGSFQVREGADKVLATVGKEDIVSVSYSGGKYHVRGSGLEYDVTHKIRFVPLNGAIMQIKSYSDPSKTYPGKNYNRFRGIIEIRKSDNSNDLWAINELRVELYLRGLGETSGEGPEEYIKALGIAARTYALYHKIITGGRSLHSGWDILNTPDDQIYRGYEYEIITPRMSSIFNQVRGIIATDDQGDKPITTVYFSDSDGRTRTAKEVWKTDRFPYLQKSVNDPYHASSVCLGHCVGMSAQGAYGFASKEGWDYKKILNYYYSNIKLVKAY